ncbi:3D domain-containing protein [Lysinibacillus sp. 54212]|uniref:3D domain-containing protein n=1 Tax=Lysinibacillus sp. 54212 TaxID=3119829 RepID=UPI002FC79433
MINVFVSALLISGVFGYEWQASIEGVQQTAAGQKSGVREETVTEKTRERGLSNVETYGQWLPSVSGRINASDFRKAAVHEGMGIGKDVVRDVQPAKQAAESPGKVLEDKSRNYGGNGTASRNSANSATFVITAYTAGYESTGKRPGDEGYGVTATGAYVKEGRTIAADWNVLPPGTVVEIEGLPGRYVVEDRGGGVRGNHIDLYIENLNSALSWGKQKRNVQVIEWGS